MSKENNKENQKKNINESVSNDPIVEINVRRSYSYRPSQKEYTEEQEFFDSKPQKTKKKENDN